MTPLARLGLLVALTLGPAGCERTAPGPEPEVMVVVRGDTLSKLAGARGCTVDQLRDWNEIDGDLIEVGQSLAWFPTLCTGAASPTPRPRGAPRATPSPAGLQMPPPKPCLAGPDAEGIGEAGMAASEGLQQDDAARALSTFVPHVLPCLADSTASPTTALGLELVVACTGRVDTVRVADRGDWPPDVARCVADTLKYTPFPAHGLPDGDTVSYPLRYTPPE